MRSDLVDIDITLHHETEKAYLVSSDVSTPEKIWVPKSLCELDGGDPPRKRGTLTLSQSLAEEKGLV